MLFIHISYSFGCSLCLIFFCLIIGAFRVIGADVDILLISNCNFAVLQNND